MFGVVQICIGALFITLLALFFVGCTSMGTKPSEEELINFEMSKQFNIKKKAFENRRPELIQEMRDKSFNWGVMKDFLSSGVDRTPIAKLPEIKPDLQKFLEPNDDLKLIWLGHSSLLLNMDGKILLIDPMFSDAASPVNFVVKRFQPPVLRLNELPEIDYILISHDHYDHLDMETIKFFATKDVKMITPLGVGAHLRSWGVNSQNIVEKDWWEPVALESLTFTATPSQHFSGRGLNDRNSTLWASWVIKSSQHNVFFCGDSGYDTHFLEIGKRLGPFDIAFLDNGQYNERWRAVHMNPDEAAQAFKDLGAKIYFPIHWGVFKLSMHSWYDPVERLQKLSEQNNFTLLAPRMGQLVYLKNPPPTDYWWREVPKEAKSEMYK